MTNTPEKIVYTARATVKGGRQGHAKSDDGVLDLTLTAPKETGGPGTGTNPEQLFAVGYGANRMIAGTHFPSDLEAGRIAAAVIAEALLRDPRFQQDLGRARAEIAAAGAASAR